MTTNESIRGYSPGHDRSIEPADEPTCYTHNSTPVGCVCTPADIETVFGALVDYHAEDNSYVRSSDLVDGLDLSKPKIGTALRILSNADDCPLIVSQWGGDATTPILYRVQGADQ